MKLALIAAAVAAVTGYIQWPRIKAIFTGPLTPPERHPVDDLMALADSTQERRVGLPTDEEIDEYMAEWGRQMRGRP